MSEDKDRIRFDYDEETRQFFVIIDAHMSRKRESLIDSILDRAEEVLKSEKARKNIYQYIIHSSSLRNVWQSLKSKDEDTLVRVLVGSGIPRLKGLRVVPPEAQGLAKLILPRDPEILKFWHWQWLYCAIKMAFVQLKIDYSISVAEIQFYLQQAKRGLDGEESRDLVLHPFSPPNPQGRDFTLRMSEHGPWIELLIFDPRCINQTNFSFKVCEQAGKILRKGLPLSNASHHILLHDFQNKIEELRSGPSSLGVGLPLSHLLAFRSPLLPTNDESLAIETIFQKAKTSLQKDQKSERLFVGANLGLSQEVLPQLTDRLNRLFNRLSIERRRHSEKHRDYLLVFSLFPFTHSEMFPQQSSLKTAPSSHSWLVWVIREMVKFDDFRFDSQWIASRLALRVPPSLIEQTLELVINKKMIYLDPVTGRYQQTVENLLTTEEVSGAAIARHYQELFELTPTALNLAGADHKSLRCLRLRLTPKEFKRLRAFISRFSRDCLTLENQVKDCQEIYHLGFLFFPFAASKPERKANLAS